MSIRIKIINYVTIIASIGLLASELGWKVALGAFLLAFYVRLGTVQ